MINIKHLMYFRVLARYQHYARAAEELEVAQPTVSRIIAELEKYLGVSLFERKGRNIILTALGKSFYEDIDKGLEEIESAIQKIKKQAGQAQKKVHLSFVYAANSDIIPHLVKRFGDRHQDVELDFYQGNTGEILERLKNNQTDIAICAPFPQEQGILFTPIASRRLMVCVAKCHPLSQHEQVDLKTLTQYPLILTIDKTQFVENLLSTHELDFQVISRVQDEFTMAGLAAADYGVGIFPENKMLESYDIDVIAIEPAVYRELDVAVCAKRKFCAAAESLYQLILQEFATGR